MIWYICLYWLHILQVVLCLKCRGAEDKRATTHQQYFIYFQWHFQRPCSPFRSSGGIKNSALLRNWLYLVLGPDGSPLTFPMCQAFFCPSDQSALVGRAMILLAAIKVAQTQILQVFFSLKKI